MDRRRRAVLQTCRQELVASYGPVTLPWCPDLARIPLRAWRLGVTIKFPLAIGSIPPTGLSACQNCSRDNPKTRFLSVNRAVFWSPVCIFLYMLVGGIGLRSIRTLFPYRGDHAI